MKNTSETRKTYTIYHTHPTYNSGRPAVNRALKRALSVMPRGTSIYVTEAERSQVHSYARSLDGTFTTKVTASGDYKVSRVA